MELTEKRMWMVNRSGFEYYPRTVLMDGEGRPKYCLDNDGDPYIVTPERAGRLYDTEGEAMAVVAANTPSDEQVMKVLSFVTRNLDRVDEARAERLKKAITDKYCEGYAETLFSGYIRRPVRNIDDIPWQFRSRAELALKGYLNIDARTFAREEVASVMWGEGSTESSDPSDDMAIRIRLKDGTSVTCRDSFDRWLVMLIFGWNESGRIYRDIRIEKEDE